MSLRAYKSFMARCLLWGLYLLWIIGAAHIFFGPLPSAILGVAAILILLGTLSAFTLPLIELLTKNH